MNVAGSRKRKRAPRLAVLEVTQLFAEYAVGVMLPKHGGKLRSSLARQVVNAFVAGAIRVPNIDLANRGFAPADVVHASAAFVCAHTGQPLVVCTRLKSLDMPRHVRLDVYLFDQIERVSQDSPAKFRRVPQSEERRAREEVVLGRLARRYRRLARNGSGVDTISKPTELEEQHWAFDVVPLRWRHLVLPILSEDKYLERFGPFLRRLFARERKEAGPAMMGAV